MLLRIGSCPRMEVTFLSIYEPRCGGGWSLFLLGTGMTDHYITSNSQRFKDIFSSMPPIQFGTLAPQKMLIGPL